MTLLEHFAGAFRQMRKNRLRSLLTTLGIAIGVAAMIAVLSVSMAGRDRINNELEKFGLNRILLYPSERLSGFDIGDADEIAAEVAFAGRVSPQAFLNTTVSCEGKTLDAEIVGTYPSLAETEHKEMREGRFLSDADIAYSRRVAVLSETTAEELFGDAAKAVGEQITLAGKPFSVVGVERNTKPLYTAVAAEKSYIPVTAFRDCLGISKAGEISISVENGGDMEKVTEESIGLLVSKYGRGTIKIMNLADEMENANAIMEIFTLVVAAIAFISLVVGGIGIMNIMLVTVHERTREIGVRKALGADRGSIMRQFLAEAAVYSLSGALAGVLLGLLLTSIASRLIGVSGGISMVAVAASVIFSAMTGLLFGILPARKAAMLDPVVALRFS